ncbi:hypothetical protein ACFLZ8_05985 [Planctomycetota bacterium]
MQNEKLSSLIKMNYTSQFTYTNQFNQTIPQSEVDLGFYDPSGMREYSNRPYTQRIAIWAQDSIKQYNNNDNYRQYESDEPVRGSLSVIDGEVMKQATKPDLMQGSIDHISNFQWSVIGPQHLGLRPLGKEKLSELLLPENVITVREDSELVDGQETYVIDVKRPGEYPFYARIWIDCERYMPIKLQHFAENPSSNDVKPVSEVIWIKLLQLPNGGWFPVEGTRISYRQQPQPYQRLSHIVVDVNSITIEKENIPYSLFDINFPVGARVYNAILDITVEYGKAENLIVERIVSDSITTLSDSDAESEQEPNISQTSTMIDTIPDETIQNTTEDLSSAPNAQSILGQSSSLVLIILFTTVAVFVLALTIFIIRYYLKTTVKGEPK